MAASAKSRKPGNPLFLHLKLGTWAKAMLCRPRRERMQGKTPGGKGKLGIVPQPQQKRNRRELVFGKKIAYTVSGGVSK